VKVLGVLGRGRCLLDNICYIEDYNNTRYNYTNIHDTYTDGETHQHGVVPSFLTQYQVPVHVVLFIFGTSGHVILLTISICNKDMRTVTNMYILNVAISDIIYLTVFSSEVCAHRIAYTWLQSEFMCTFLPFCRRLSVGLSAYSIAVLSIQRYRVTVNPLHVRVSSQPTWRVTVATICGVWIVAALFAVPSALTQYLCEEIFILGTMPYYRRVVIFELIVSCVFPLCIIAFTYIMTALHLVEKSCPLFEGTQNTKFKTRKNTAKIVVGLTIVFLLSYVPYHAFWTYIICAEPEYNYYERINDVILKWNSKLRYTYLISTCFLLINSCLNPVALFCNSSPLIQHFER